MKWLYKLERRYGRYAIPNLMLYITTAMGAVFVLQYFTTFNVYGLLSLNRWQIMEGQVWRLVTFLAIPGNGLLPIVGTLFFLYFNYFIGIGLEDMWGSFKFNIFYLCGALSAILSMVIIGFGSNYYLSLTMFLAYAYLHPEQEFLIFFILPVKAKYIALADWLIILVEFIGGGWPARVGIALALVNFFLFFGGNFTRYIRNQMSWYKTRRNFRRHDSGNIRYH